MPELLEWVRVQPVLVGLAFVFASSAAEYVFPPLPADAMVLSGALLVVSGAAAFGLVYSVAVAGGILGASAQYLLGRALARAGKLDRPWVARVFGRGALERFRTQMDRYGVRLILFNRIFPGVRGVTFLAAGAAELPLFPTFVAGVASHVVWMGFVLGLGVTIAESAEKILATFYVQQTYLFAFGGSALLLFAAVKVWQRQRRA